MTKLDKSKFSPLFGDWWPKIVPFFDNDGFEPIYEQLKKDSQRGKKIAPLSNNVYRCFIETPLKNLRGVILGFCPYHSYKNYMPVADGLAMSCSVTGKLQPSLELFYNAVEKELYEGLCLDGRKNPDLTFLAQQGILLFNSSLTTEMNKAGSHQELWEPFTRYIFEDVLSVERVPVMFLGKESGKFEKYMPPMSWSFPISHPASAAYSQQEWSSGGAIENFSKVIKDLNNYDVEWLDFGNYNNDDAPF